MSVILICDWFDVIGRDGIKTGRKEYTVSHGVDLDTGSNVILPCDHPRELGATNRNGEWYLD